MPNAIRPSPVATVVEQYEGHSIEVEILHGKVTVMHGTWGRMRDASFKVRRAGESAIGYAGVVGRSFASAPEALAAALTNARNWIGEQPVGQKKSPHTASSERASAAMMLRKTPKGSGR